MTRREAVHSFTGFGLAAGALQTIALAAKRAADQSPTETAADEDFWMEVRQAFTTDRAVINLNNGSLCPAPRAVQEAMHHYWDITNLQPSIYVDQILIPRTQQIRERLAQAFGCDPEEMALTRNTSEGLHNVINGIDLKRGDEVITTTQDYPTMINAFKQRERRDGIVLKQFAYPSPPKSAAELHDLFMAQVTSRTRAILVSHMTFTTGQMFPVKELCTSARARGVYSIVDGAHGFGHIPLKASELNCDFYATSLHKWLTAPVGTGFLYMRRELIPQVWPLMGGAPAEMTNNIRKFESIGTAPLAMRNAIAEALTIQDGLGVERKSERLRYLRRRWFNRLQGHPKVIMRIADDPSLSCGIGALTVKGKSAAELTNQLWTRFGIHVRERVIPNEFECIRVSPNLYTSIQEIDRFSEAIERIAG